jgi:predicted permease
MRGHIVTSPSKGVTNYFTVIARLQPSVTPATAQAVLSAQMAASLINVKVQPIATYMTSNLRPLALGAIIASLMISLACAANVANLLIARGAYRKREFAVREALGASQADLLRLILVELSAVTSLAIILSLALAHLVLAVITQVIPAEYTVLGQPAVTLRSVAFAGILGIGIIFAAIVPVWVTWRTALSSVISQSLALEARKVKWLRFFMAASQSATAMTLLVGGTLLVRSYVNLWSQETGFSGNVGIVSVSYPQKEPAMRLAEDISSTTERLRRIPGVVTAAAASGPLLDNYGSGGFVRVAGINAMIPSVQITTGFFDTVGTTLRTGRPLGPNDRGWNAVVINEAFARVFWPDAALESAIGQIGTLFDGRTMQIAGVVRDMRDKALDKSPSPMIYLPIEKPNAFLPVNYVVRLHNRSANFDAAARRAITAVNADAVVTEASLIDERLASTVRARSFATLILSLFAIAGLGITASGLFGIVAFVVARRTREIAIRIAVGAQARHILWVVVREAVSAATFGTASGLLVGRWLSEFLKSQLYSIIPGDAGSLAGAAVAMIMVVAIAALIPAQRALRLSPTEALRLE